MILSAAPTLCCSGEMMAGYLIQTTKSSNYFYYICLWLTISACNKMASNECKCFQGINGMSLNACSVLEI